MLVVRRDLACLLVLLACGVTACHRVADSTASQSGADAPDDARPADCPAQAKAPATLPNTPPELGEARYWLERAPRAPEAVGVDDVLLDSDALAAHAEALAHADDQTARLVDLSRPLTGEALRAALSERLTTYRQLFESGKYRSRRASALGELREGEARLSEQQALHVALAPIDLRCAPFPEPIESQGGSAGIDRNRCSQARAQEPIELLGDMGAMWLARTRNAFGFIQKDAPLSPQVPSELSARYRARADVALTRDLALAPLGNEALPHGTLLRSAEPGTVWLASPRGFTRSRALTRDEALSTVRPLTRRAFLTEAFRYLDAPYGWGDQNGGRDCSRFVLDVLASFGLTLPRTSAHQSRSGRYTVELPPETSETERLALLDAAHARGLVLIHFPGHIMFYLGRDEAGVPRVLHSFAEYLAPCPHGGETLFEVGRVAVSDMALGKNTSRRSFLERMTHLTVFGRAPGYELLALSRFRAPQPPLDLDPARCREGEGVSLFHSPREPDPARPLRVVAVSREDVRPASVWLVSPSGELVSPEVHDLGVGPYARWAEVEAPSPGRWRVLVADGARTLSCHELRVGAASAQKSAEARAAEAPAWKTTRRWDASTEQLYAAFVEQLFSHPVEDLTSWASLSELLVKPERNLLFDHRGLGEDTRLSLAPDCADLPYLLRAYFAWKMGLPFAFRYCSRGRAGVAPRCEPTLMGNETLVAARDDLEGFAKYWQLLTSGVHSASGRTLPDDPDSDLYPVALEREALPPGTVFADPYGHLIVVGKWLPQGLAGAGMLLGADAQPDATVGRRRFWRGNFLFTPDVTEVGAGFKAFRPLLLASDARLAKKRTKAARTAPTAEATGLVALDDAAIAESRDFRAPSRAQYAGSAEAFYERMDHLIYPRPVALSDRMQRVVDALDEQVARRVEAVDVGEAALRERREPVAMPEGYAIFETAGAWEDFATPSRDMRLLIAIDAVRGFPASVRAAPERYGVASESAELRALETQLAGLLAARRFRYTRSDGSSFELSLADVVARGDALEVAYNPNDCVEVRWGAPAGSAEQATCRRTAPAAQRALMERYRPWFHGRTRPARPARAKS